MVTVSFYNYTGDNNKVDKVLNTPTEIKGVIVDRFDILQPVIKIKSKTPVTFNYAYIKELNRFYFVNGVDVDGDIYYISFRVDVLNTYKEIIKQSKGTLISGEAVNKYADNRINRYDVRPNLTKFDFTEKDSFVDEGKIIMVTIKGNK